MKPLLVVTGSIEVLTGLAVLAVPALLVSFSPGEPLDPVGGLAIGRLPGAALLALAAACCRVSSEERSRTAAGIVTAMLLYNVVVVSFICLHGGADLTGPGLLPATTLHAATTGWCIVCLRPANSPRNVVVPT